MATRRFDVPDGPAMQDLGEALGRVLVEGSTVLLRGPLGAGKTTLTQGIARGLAVDGRVSSPSFTLIREHQCGRLAARLIHMDFYRLSGGTEVWALGVTDYLDGDDIVVVEWPERAGADLIEAAQEGVVIADLEYTDVGRSVVVSGLDTASSERVRSMSRPRSVVER